MSDSLETVLDGKLRGVAPEELQLLLMRQLLQLRRIHQLMHDRGDHCVCGGARSGAAMCGANESGFDPRQGNSLGGCLWDHYTCTRDPGHEGPHVACAYSSDLHFLHTWCDGDESLQLRFSDESSPAEEPDEDDEDDRGCDIDGHDWSDNDGICAYCYYRCQHGDGWTHESVCEICGWSCDHESVDDEGRCDMCEEIVDEDAAEAAHAAEAARAADSAGATLQVCPACGAFRHADDDHTCKDTNGQ